MKNPEWNQLDERLRDTVVVSDHTVMRARNRFHAHITPARRRMPFSLAAVSFVGVAAIALAVLTSPSMKTPSTHFSFLQTAQAAYADMRAEAVSGTEKIRHLVTESVHTGSINSPLTEHRETWMNQDGTRALENVEGTVPGLIPTVVTHNGVAYAPPAYLQPSGEEDFKNADFVSMTGEDVSFNYNAPDNFTISFPSDWNQMSTWSDPEDPSVECYAFDKKSQDQMKKETFEKELNIATGFDGLAIGSPEATIAKLIEGEQKGYVTDAGIRMIEGSETRVFIVTDIISNDGFTQTNTQTFLFDPVTYRLVGMSFSFKDDIGGPTKELVTTYRILTDELVDLKDVPEAYHDPLAAGLVEQPVYPGPWDLPTYEITEDGCYRSTEHGPERLSTEEESAVLERLPS